MAKKENKFSRRKFFKLAGAAGFGSILAPMDKFAHASNKLESAMAGSLIVPTRPFGKTGVNVSMLALGGSQDLMSKQLLLRQAIKMGVTYWDTAYRYEGGNSEKAIGKYFSRYPEDRKKVFLVTKMPSSIPQKMSKYLHTSLERLNTSYIDLLFIHAVSDVKDEINHETKKWVEAAKAKGKVLFFGFSTHKNMAQCLTDGAKLGWIE